MKNIKTAVVAAVTGLVTASAGTYGLAKGNNSPEKNKITETVTAHETNSVPEENYVPVENVAPKILNIGDSRTVGMYFSENRAKYSNEVNTADNAGNLWFAKVGQGLKWFENNLSTIQKHAKNSNIVVINLGINDLAASGNSDVTAQKYLIMMNKLAKAWQKDGKKVFFSSINPVGPQYSHARLFNQKIDNFNRQMRDNLSSEITFIDTNTFIKDKLKSSDFDKFGLHYVPSVNKSVHAYIESKIMQQWSAAHNKSRTARFAEFQNTKER